MADAEQKTVATPCADYTNMLPIWTKCRAICAGEEAVKAHDADVQDEDNFLVPFSTSMQQDQYDFLKREAELPGVTSEFAHLLVGSLLRREPEVASEKAPEGAIDWITQEFGADGSPIVSYLDGLLWEEVTVTRGWTFVDYADSVPFPVFWKAESVINWTRTNKMLTRVIVSLAEAVPSESEFHSLYRRVYNVHEIENGIYQIRKFAKNDKNEYVELTDEPIIPLFHDQPLTYIPAWPSNGEIDPVLPFLLVLINKEIALYNKITRRNHLLYNASTYTPYTIGLDDGEHRKVVGAGLGSWLNLPAGSEIGVLKAPTESLADLEKSIANGFEEMAKLGIRMLSPENAQSGVALQLRNASQTARVGTLNTRISVIMRQVIAFMINWRYGSDLRAEDVKFSLQSDFSMYTRDGDWLRLVTEWYENGHIPRSIWVRILRNSEAIPDDYNDDDGKVEIAESEQFSKTYIDKTDEQGNLL